MIEGTIIEYLSVTFSGASVAGVALILYRMGQLERDVQNIRDDHKDTSAKVIRLETLSEVKAKR